MTDRFWQDNPDAPFAALLDVVETYCHPEAYDEACDDLRDVVARPDRDPIFDRFKDELRLAISRPSQVPRTALSDAAQYYDGSAERFIPVESSQQAAGQLAGEAKLMEIEGAQHGFAVHEDPEYLEPQTQEWQALVIRTVAEWVTGHAE